MKVSLFPTHLARYKDIALLLLKYGYRGYSDRAALEAATLFDEEAPGDSAMSARADAFAADLERLGPAFIKLGQLLSTRADFLPLPYLRALSRLQDRVQPFPYEQVEEIVQSELGVRISKAFGSFDQSPLAAASLGQVHRATLKDGTPVVVKVQRPGIRETLLEDLAALETAAEFVENHVATGGIRLGRTAQEFRRSVLRELDYRIEAANLVRLGANLARFERLVVPQPVDDYTSARLLTMDYIRGSKVTDLTPLARIDIDGDRLADELFAAYMHQILVDGFFHADPHPGNVFITEDGRLALLDLGMTGRTSPEMQDSLLKLLLAISEGRAEDAAAIAIAIGDASDTFDEGAFRHDLAELVTRHHDASVEQLEVGRLVLEVTRIAGQNGTQLPSELTLVAKTLLNLDLVARTLDPGFQPNAAIRRHAASIMQRRLLESLSPGNVFAGLLEMKDLARRLPARLNQLVDTLAGNRLRIRVDAIDEARLMQGFQKVANRITVGLILAALIVGAAMLMRVDTPFKLFGYPGFAILLFLVAAFVGIWLVATILLSDVRQKG